MKESRNENHTISDRLQRRQLVQDQLRSTKAPKQGRGGAKTPYRLQYYSISE